MLESNGIDLNFYASNKLMNHRNHALILQLFDMQHIDCIVDEQLCNMFASDYPAFLSPRGMDGETMNGDIVPSSTITLLVICFNFLRFLMLSSLFN